MADACDEEVSKDNVSDGAESPPTSPPCPPEPAAEEAPPEVKEEVEDPPPKVVSFDCEIGGSEIQHGFTALSFF